MYEVQGALLITQDSFLEPYEAIGVLIALVVATAVVMLLLAHLIGPKRHGSVKDSPYESGMPIIAGADRRLHIRFYVVALLFLLFDVEVIFLWPWATAFYASAVDGMTIPLEGGGIAGKDFLLVGMGFFVSLLLFGLVYEWKKGAFRWE